MGNLESKVAGTRGRPTGAGAQLPPKASQLLLHDAAVFVVLSEPRIKEGRYETKQRWRGVFDAWTAASELGRNMAILFGDAINNVGDVFRWASVRDVQVRADGTVITWEAVRPLSGWNSMSLVKINSGQGIDQGFRRGHVLVKTPDWIGKPSGNVAVPRVVPASMPRLGGRSDAAVGLPYAMVAAPERQKQRDPFEIDPDEVDRGNRAHTETQNALATYLESVGVQPRRSAPAEPRYDLAWEHGETVFVAEVKSITDGNKDKQLRLGVGQVLHYRYELARGGREVVAVLVTERSPDTGGWIEFCASLGVTIVWPGAFDRLPF